MQLVVAIVFGEEKHELLAHEGFLFEARLGAVKVFDRVALPELSLERLDHFANDSPVFITDDAIGDLGLLNANVCDDSDGFVITAQITQRRPVVVVLRPQRNRDGDENEQGCKREFQAGLLRSCAKLRHYENRPS
jgi:hypothetical protein